VAEWGDRHIWIDLWTLGGMPRRETGCTRPDLIHVSEARLTDSRWRTWRGLHVGDSAARLRRLYPYAHYDLGERFDAPPRRQYWLVKRHGPCIGVCSPAEQRDGVDYPRLTAQVRNGQVIAFWLPVFGQGE
jgi:hypothetical protein